MPDFGALIIYAMLCTVVMGLEAILSRLDRHGDKAGLFWLYDKADEWDS
jgi:hypothetical protein